MRILGISLLAILAANLAAEELQFVWDHDGQNTKEYIFEALKGEEWVEVGRIPVGTREFELTASEQYDGARVCASNDWGRSGYAENLKAKISDPEGLKITRKIENESTVKTTITEYE